MNMILRYLSPAKFAELTGISKLGALRMIEEGKLKALEIEGKTLIDVDSFNTFADSIEAHHVEAQPIDAPQKNDPMQSFNEQLQQAKKTDLFT